MLPSQMTSTKASGPVELRAQMDAPAAVLRDVLEWGRPIYIGEPRWAAALLGVATDAEMLTLCSLLLPAGTHLHAFARALTDARLVRLWEERWGAELEATLRFEALRRGLYDLPRVERDIERAAKVSTWVREPIESMFRFPEGTEHGWTPAEVLDAVAASHVHVVPFRDALRTFHERKRHPSNALELGGLFTFALVANEEWCGWLAHLARGPNTPPDLSRRLATVLHGRADASRVLAWLAASGLPEHVAREANALRASLEDRPPTAAPLEAGGVQLSHEDYAWTGPFDTDRAIEAMLETAIEDAGFQRDDDSGALVSVVVARVGSSLWAQVPALLARGEQPFFVQLVFDPEDEWGAPVGYDVHAVIHRDGTAWRGELMRSVREDMHPDSGAVDGGIAEACRRAGGRFESEHSLEVGVLGW